MAMNSSFPMDIIYDILLLLPVKSLVRFKCVCKSWRTLIECSDFIKSHLNLNQNHSNYSLIFNVRVKNSHLHYFPDFREISRSIELNLPPFFGNSFGWIGCCNGLICLKTRYNLAVCNPSTRVFKLVPDDPFTRPGQMLGVWECFGFGYDNRDDDYKIVRILSKDKFMVYSLKTDSWNFFSHHGQLPQDHGNDGVLVNNRLHWRRDYNIRQIICFDLHDQEWRTIPLPYNSYVGIEYVFIRLGVFDGCLCVSFTIYPSPPDNDDEDEEEDCSDVWVMKEYGVEESWAKVYSFPYAEVIPMASYKERCEVLFSKRQERSIFLWNSQLKRISEIEGPPTQYCRVQLCIESLTPLMGNCYVLKEKTPHGRERGRGRRRRKGRGRGRGPPSARGS